MFTSWQSSTASLAQPKFSSSQQLEAQLKKCVEQTKSSLCTLWSSFQDDMLLSAKHQRVFTDALAVLASLRAHAELAKANGVQKQVCELCKRLLEGIKILAGKKALFDSYDEHIGAVLAQLLLQELELADRTSLALPDLLWVFGEMCLASPRTRASAVERSASHRLAGLCEQATQCAWAQKHARIALCKLLYTGVDEHFIFESRYVNLLIDKTIEAPDDGECTAWVLTVLCTMQEKNERALHYIWQQSPISRAIVDVMSSDQSQENLGKIIRLLRFPASKPELRMLLARSGVWEVLRAIVARADVNNMTLQRFAEVFYHFAVCPVTGPLLVGLDADHTLVTALEQVKYGDATTVDKLLLCAYNCCKQNKAFADKIADSGLLEKMHSMSVRARLYTLSICLARYTATFGGQEMGPILAREVDVLTRLLRADKAMRCGLSTRHENDWMHVWVGFVHDVRDSDVRALAPELVQEFAAALLASTNRANVSRGPALHLLARMVSCRTCVRVRACDVRMLADQELPYASVTASTGLLALAGSVYDAADSAASAKPDAQGPNSCAEAAVDAGATVQAVGGGDTSHAAVTAVTAVTEHDTDSEDDFDTCKIGLTRDDLQAMEDAFPTTLPLLGKLLWLWPVFSPAQLDRLCDMFLAAFQATRSQCLLTMDVIDALLPSHKKYALKLVRHCGLDQLWNTVEKRMPHCEQQASVEFMCTFRSVCLLARQENEQSVLDTLLTLPFYAALLAHLERTVAGHELELAHALVNLLHTVLDVQPAAAAELLLGGAALKLVRVRDTLSGGAGAGTCLHKEISRVVQRVVPGQLAALVERFAQPANERSQRKRKLQECVQAESV